MGLKPIDDDLLACDFCKLSFRVCLSQDNENVISNISEFSSKISKVKVCDIFDPSYLLLHELEDIKPKLKEEKNQKRKKTETEYQVIDMFPFPGDWFYRFCCPFCFSKHKNNNNSNHNHTSESNSNDNVNNNSNINGKSKSKSKKKNSNNSSTTSTTTSTLTTIKAKNNAITIFISVANMGQCRFRVEKMVFPTTNTLLTEAFEKSKNLTSINTFVKIERLNRPWIDCAIIAIHTLYRLSAHDIDWKWFGSIGNFIDVNFERLCVGKNRTTTWRNTLGSAMSQHDNFFVSGTNILDQAGFWRLHKAGKKLKPTQKDRWKYTCNISERIPIIVGTKKKATKEIINGFAVPAPKVRHMKNLLISKINDKKFQDNVNQKVEALFIRKPKDTKKLTVLPPRNSTIRKSNSNSSSSSSSSSTSSKAKSSKSSKSSAKAAKKTEPKPRPEVQVIDHINYNLLYPPKYFDPIHPYWSGRFSKQVFIKENSAPQMDFNADGLEVGNNDGYRTARSAFGVCEGSWYCEMSILSTPTGSVRLGFCTTKANVQVPVGCCENGFGWRGKPSTYFHKARGQPFGKKGFKPGDTVGMLIELHGKEKSQKNKGRIIFFVNGALEGKITIPNEKEDSKTKETNTDEQSEGYYYPASSLYYGGRVKANFGPNFQYLPALSPSQPMSFKPFCEAVVLPKETDKKPEDADNNKLVELFTDKVKQELVPKLSTNNSEAMDCSSDAGDANKSKDEQDTSEGSTDKMEDEVAPNVVQDNENEAVKSTNTEKEVQIKDKQITIEPDKPISKSNKKKPKVKKVKVTVSVENKKVRQKFEPAKSIAFKQCSDSNNSMQESSARPIQSATMFSPSSPPLPVDTSWPTPTEESVSPSLLSTELQQSDELNLDALAINVHTINTNANPNAPKSKSKGTKAQAAKAKATKAKATKAKATKATKATKAKATKATKATKASATKATAIKVNATTNVNASSFASSHSINVNNSQNRVQNVQNKVSTLPYTRITTISSNGTVNLTVNANANIQYSQNELNTYNFTNNYASSPVLQNSHAQTSQSIQSIQARQISQPVQLRQAIQTIQPRQAVQTQPVQTRQTAQPTQPQTRQTARLMQRRQTMEDSSNCQPTLNGQLIKTLQNALKPNPAPKIKRHSINYRELMPNSNTANFTFEQINGLMNNKQPANANFLDEPQLLQFDNNYNNKTMQYRKPTDNNNVQIHIKPAALQQWAHAHNVNTKVQSTSTFPNIAPRPTAYNNTTAVTTTATTANNSDRYAQLQQRIASSQSLKRQQKAEQAKLQQLHQQQTEKSSFVWNTIEFDGGRKRKRSNIEPAPARATKRQYTPVHNEPSIQPRYTQTTATPRSTGVNSTMMNGMRYTSNVSRSNGSNAPTSTHVNSSLNYY